MSEDKKFTTLSDFCGTNDNETVESNSEVEGPDDIDTGDIDVNKIDFSETTFSDGVNMETYYLCGIKDNDGDPELVMTFDFKKSELNRAIMHSAQYNTLTPEERLDFDMEYHASLGSAFVCAAYTTVAENLLWVIKAEETTKEWTEDELKEYIESIDMEEIKSKAINILSMLKESDLV